MREFTIYTEEDFGGLHVTTVFGERFMIDERGKEIQGAYARRYAHVDIRVDGVLIRSYEVVSIVEQDGEEGTELLD